MFNLKTLGVIAVVLSLGASCSLAQINSKKVAPLSASEKSLTKCKLHGVKLQLGTVPIHYGIASGLSQSYYLASQKFFPYAHSLASGGCVIYKDIPGLQAVKFCPKCREVEKRWLASHQTSRAKR